jgi:hypothetical protein
MNDLTADQLASLPRLERARAALALAEEAVLSMPAWWPERDVARRVAWAIEDWIEAPSVERLEAVERAALELQEVPLGAPVGVYGAADHAAYEERVEESGEAVAFVLLAVEELRPQQPADESFATFSDALQVYPGLRARITSTLAPAAS